jgi:dihydroorotate dehydrogenase (fumarate)
MKTNTNYLGLELKSPIVIGSCSLTCQPERVRELASAGAGAAVLPSLFEEQIVHQLIADGKSREVIEDEVESRGYDPSEDEYNGGPNEYLEMVRQMADVASIPIIASLNGCSGGHWLEFSNAVEQAGADALEISLDGECLDRAMSADQVEEELIACVRKVCGYVSIPVSVKLSSFHTNLSNLAWRLAEAGAQGVVCFAHEPAWRVGLEETRPKLTWELTPASSTNQTIAGLLRLRRNGSGISVAACGGISTAEDLSQVIIAGASVAMVTSEVYRSGPEAVSRLLEGLCSLMESRGFQSFADFASSRPKLHQSMRSRAIGALTKAGEFVDPTTAIGQQCGDRWGHLQ